MAETYNLDTFSNGTHDEETIQHEHNSAFEADR